MTGKILRMIKGNNLNKILIENSSGYKKWKRSQNVIKIIRD
jgi:hypothetical protein